MTDKEQYRKDYERYLKIKDKIKNSEDRSFLINFLLREGGKEYCKAILREVDKAGFVYFGEPSRDKLKQIIKDLGVEDEL